MLSLFVCLRSRAFHLSLSVILIPEVTRRYSPVFRVPIVKFNAFINESRHLWIQTSIELLSRRLCVGVAAALRWISRDLILLVVFALTLHQAVPLLLHCVVCVWQLAMSMYVFWECICVCVFWCATVCVCRSQGPGLVTSVPIRTPKLTRFDYRPVRVGVTTQTKTKAYPRDGLVCKSGRDNIAIPHYYP